MGHIVLLYLFFSTMRLLLDSLVWNLFRTVEVYMEVVMTDVTTSGRLVDR